MKGRILNMNEIKKSTLLTLRILAVSGIIATIFYLGHVIGGRMIWTEYNPLSQPISDLTAASSISQPVASKILWGYDIFNLLFCGVLVIFFNKIYKINITFYIGIVLKTLAEILSTIGYKIFPLSDTTWENSFQNTMHYAITAIIVISYIVLSIMLVIGLSKTKKHYKMLRFLRVFCVVFIASGFLTVIATQALPPYVGLIERVNLYSLMVLKFALSLWVLNLLSLLPLKTDEVIKI